MSQSPKTNTIRSKFKFFGGFGFDCMLLGLLIWFFFMGIKLYLNPYKPQTYQDETPILLPYLSILAVVFFLWGFSISMRIITVDAYGIKIRFLLFPFFVKRYSWSDFDYAIKVRETFRYNEYKAIWLVKNERCILRFNERYYSNFKQLSIALKPKIMMSKELSNVKILAAILGFRVKID